MRYATDESEIKEIKKYLKLTADEAIKSKCKKSQRGVVIVKSKRIISRGNNKVTLERICNPCIREHIKDNSKVELCSAIHAEQTAIINAIKKGKSLKNSKMYHIKVKDGKMCPSGKPSCTVCSRMVLESGIAEFINLEKVGKYAVYDSREFNELSYQYFADK